MEDLTATRQSDTEITVAWTTADQSVQIGFTIQYRKQGSSTWNELDEGSDTRTVDIDDLHPGCRYDFRVTPYSGSTAVKVDGGYNDTQEHTCTYHY